MRTSQSWSKRLVGWTLCVGLVTMSMPAQAAPPAVSLDELRHAAFLRGGKAIAVALVHPTEAEPMVSPAIEEALPRTIPPTAPQTSRDSGKLAKWQWGVLIGGFVATGLILYHIGTGPGASVRNCSTCK